MRIAHWLRPGEDNDFSVETADALVEFWKNLTRVLFSVDSGGRRDRDRRRRDRHHEHHAACR